MKDRSITQPRASLITLSPSWNGGRFGTYRLADLRITFVRVYLNFDLNPVHPGRHVYDKTHAQAFFLSKEMFEVGFELVSSTMANVMVLPTELPG